MTRKQTLNKIARTLKQFPGNKSWAKIIKDKFPFRIPDQYPQWEELSRIIGYQMNLAEMGIERINTHALLMGEICKQARIWASYPKPKIFCVQTELIEQLKHTDLEESPELLLDLKGREPSFMLLFPPKLIESPNTGYLDYCVVNFIGDRHPLPPDYTLDPPRKNPEYQTMIFWSALDSNGEQFLSYRGIRPDGTFKKSNFTGDNEKQKQAAINLRNLILQLVMMIEYSPESVGEISVKEMQSSPGKGFSKPSSEVWYPKRLGSRKRESSVKIGSKKSPHWVRGHWRRQPTGKRENPEYKWIHIKPFKKG